ncbi:MAG TPA: hypothetical protein VKK19_01070, partial [Candidatus Dormibacteraeota bacterium]|nr:hypothetical protein [Candidatus Dormibacteraeota bacterium]
MSAELTESSSPAPPVARQRRWHLWPRSLKEWAVRLASVIVVLAVWQLYAPHVNPIFLRPPSQVVAAFVKLASDGVLLTATVESVHNLLIGFLLALVFGLAIGLASAR